MKRKDQKIKFLAESRKTLFPFEKSIRLFSGNAFQCMCLEVICFSVVSGGFIIKSGLLFFIPSLFGFKIVNYGENALISVRGESLR